MISRIVAGFILTFNAAIFGEAALEFLGFNNPHQVTWGTMLFWAYQQNAVASKRVVGLRVPGLAISLTIVALIFLQYGSTSSRTRSSATRSPAPLAHREARHLHRRAPRRGRGGDNVSVSASEQRVSTQPVAAEPLVEFQDLVVEYVLPNRRVRPVDNVSLTDQRGRDHRARGDPLRKAHRGACALRICARPARSTGGLILFARGHGQDEPEECASSAGGTSRSSSRARWTRSTAAARRRPVRRHAPGAREDPQGRGARTCGPSCSSSSASQAPRPLLPARALRRHCASASSSRWRCPPPE